VSKEDAEKEKDKKETSMYRKSMTRNFSSGTKEDNARKEEPKEIEQMTDKEFEEWVTCVAPRGKLGKFKRYIFAHEFLYLTCNSRNRLDKIIYEVDKIVNYAGGMDIIEHWELKNEAGGPKKYVETGIPKISKR
jgi:hypothetical protein